MCFSRWPALLVVLFAQSALAAGTCYQWGNQTIGGVNIGWHDSAAAAGQAWATRCNAVPSDGSCDNSACSASSIAAGRTCTFTYVGYTVGTWPAVTLQISRYFIDAPGYPGGTSGTATQNKTPASRLNPDGCPECPASGTTAIAGGLASTSGGTFCMNKCKYKTPVSTLIISGLGAAGNMMMAESTGEACAQSTESSTPTDTAECMSVAGVGYVCAEPSEGKDCGSVNGDLVCVTEIQNGCVGYGSGASACTSTSATPPKPDNGTPGDPATPTTNFTYGSTTINYYNSSIVNNSSTGATNTGTVGGEATETGNTSGGGGGSGEEGEGECMPGEECAGDLPAQGSAGECDDFTACFSSFLGRVQGAPILEAVNGVSAAFPTGACPAWNLEAFGETYALSAPMCEIWDEAAPILSAAFLFIWGWVATRIFLSA